MPDDSAAKKAAPPPVPGHPATSGSRWVARESRASSNVRTARTDAEVVRAVAGGDRDALAELYDRHAPLMLPLAQKILRTRLDAEDLLHDVFVEVWRKAADYDEARGSVRSWLVLRVRSRALDRLRSPAYSRTISDANLEIAAPEADHETASAARVAETAMRKLPAEQQRVLDLLYFQGLTLSEMATLLDQPIGTLKSRLARALRSLREELVQEGALES